MNRVVHKPLIAAVLLVLALALPSGARASAGAVIRDCAQDGHLDGHYSNSELRQALNNMPSDLDEYSDCRDIISGAITSGSGRGGGGQAQPAHAGPRHRGHARGAARTHTRRAAKPTHDRFRAGGHVVEPGKNGLFKPASSTQSLPTPLLLALIAAGLMAATGGLLALRRRIPALSKLPLPSVKLPRLRRQ